MMKLMSAAKRIGTLAMLALLTACGGGGGSGNDSAFNPPGINVSVTSSASSARAGQAVDVSVRVTQANGAPVTDGTQVTGVVTPASLGTISGIGANGLTGSATAGTVGGIANFRFTGSSSGNATLTFSAVDNGAGGRSVSSSVAINVTPGVDRVSIAATTATLPINAFNVSPFIGSPYMAEVTVTVRTASGQLISEEDGLAVSVNPVGNTGGFTTLDDPETEDDDTTPEIENNEFLIRLGQGPVDLVAGKATIFFHSLNFSGQSTLTVSALDPESNEVVSASMVFTMVSSTVPLPAQVFVSPTTAPQYIQASGGPTSGQFEVQVLDGIGQPVPNPTSGNSSFNNVQLELVGDAFGARLSGVNASGAGVSGSTISVRTVSGVSGGVLISGTATGNVRIRATSDAADNNVDNGIQSAVFGERTVAVSDGILFDLDITQPTVNALTINPVLPGVTTEDGDLEDGIPVSPDGTYSLTVGVIATDRMGNPVIPGTGITFGLVDEPQQFGFGDFFLAGGDGNPQEGGTLFTAPGGAFLTAGGGAGPGDTLALFAEDVIGNRDHEGSRRVTSVNSQTTLTVARRFNHNDTTGAIVNSGPVIPYLIGRAADGNIVASGVTDSLGVARTIMNYPVSKLGKTAVVWAQGDGDLVNGAPETVGDVEFLGFAGVAPATLVADPASIPGNRTVPVTVCVFDALGSGIGNVFVSFGYSSEEGGSASVNGVSGPGFAPVPTDNTGCAVLQVTTSGVLEEGGDIVFSGAGASDTVEVVTGGLILTAQPSLFVGGGGTTTLRLVDSGGTAVSGVQLTGSCEIEGGGTLTTVPASGTSGVTDANGEARFTIVATGINTIGEAGGGTCTYTTAAGTPEAVVTIQGVDPCDEAFSPQPPECGP